MWCVTRSDTVCGAGEDIVLGALEEMIPGEGVMWYYR